MKIKIVSLCLIVMLFMSCDPSSEYVYVINNESDETVTVEVYSGSDRNDDHLPEYAYIITSGNVEDGKISIAPNTNVSLSYYVACSAFIQDDPEKEGVPLWSERSCIKDIYVGYNLIPESDWRNSANWPRRNKKRSYAEYWYSIKNEF